MHFPYPKQHKLHNSTNKHEIKALSPSMERVTLTRYPLLFFMTGFLLERSTTENLKVLRIEQFSVMTNLISQKTARISGNLKH